MKKPIAQLGRLAFRVEGGMWSAYYAMPGTMEGALFLGQIAMPLVDIPERRAAFMALMRESVSDTIERETGERPLRPEPDGVPAPPHERAGRA